MARRPGRRPMVPAMAMRGTETLSTCDRDKRICYDRYGIDYYATHRYLGGKAAKYSANRYGDQIYLFAPKQGVICDRRSQSCSDGNGLNAAITRDYFSKTDTRRAAGWMNADMFAPQDGVACSRTTQICSDASGPSVYFTQFYLGRQAAVDLANQQNQPLAVSPQPQPVTVQPDQPLAVVTPEPVAVDPTMPEPASLDPVMPEEPVAVMPEPEVPSFEPVPEAAAEPVAIAEPDPQPVPSYEPAPSFDPAPMPEPEPAPAPDMQPAPEPAPAAAACESDPCP